MFFFLPSCKSNLSSHILLIGHFQDYCREWLTVNKQRHSDCNCIFPTIITPEYKCCRAAHWLSNDAQLVINLMQTLLTVSDSLQ